MSRDFVTTVRRGRAWTVYCGPTVLHPRQSQEQGVARIASVYVPLHEAFHQGLQIDRHLLHGAMAAFHHRELGALMPFEEGLAQIVFQKLRLVPFASDDQERDIVLAAFAREI